MSWTISLCIGLVLTSLSGTIAFLIWKVCATYMEQRNKLRWVYPMLAVVEFFFVLPLGYAAVMLWQNAADRTTAGRGYLFIGTGPITVLSTVGAFVWLAGVLYYLGKFGKKIWMINFVLPRSCMPAEPELVLLAGDIRRKLGIRQRVRVCQSYLIRVPLVTNGFRKRIVFPVGEFDRQEAEVILSHELTHVKQGILPLKLIGSLAKVVYWFNPCARTFMRELDEWGETACDVSVRYDAGCVEDFHEYFTVILASVERQMHVPDEWTQLTKEKGVEKRVMRIKGYKRENDWKLAGGIAAMLIFCLTCTTTVAAAGVGVGAGYNKLYQSTVNDVVESDNGDGVIEYEEEWNPEDHNVVEAPVDQMTRTSDNLSWDVPPHTVYHTPGFYVTSGSTITVSVTCRPSGYPFIAGILTPDGKRRYVSSTSGVYHDFDITVSGTYYVFVENLSDVTLQATGYYVY